MNSSNAFKTKEEIERLNFEELKTLYSAVHIDSLDEWFPINYVTEMCPFCKGEAMLFENFKELHMRIICVNNACEKCNSIVEQFVKGDDFLREAIAIKLGIEA